MKKYETGEKLYYAFPQANGELGVREMADRIQNSCTVTRADIMAVLVALSGVIVDGLKSGAIVRMGDLGCFQIGLSSRGTETKEEFSSANITKARINFRPGKDLAIGVERLSFRQVPTKAEAKTEEAEAAAAGENAEQNPAS